MEKYGEKPKKFTKLWFEYVWDYYKIHIIVSILVVIAVVYTVIAIKGAKQYDLCICIAGDNHISDTSKEKIKESLKDKISDINGDGEINIKLIDLSVQKKSTDAEYENAMNEKLKLELQAGESFLFVFSDEKAEELVSDPSADGLFMDSDKLVKKEHENKYFVKAENCSLLKDAGIPYDDLYIGVRNIRHNEKDKDVEGQKDNALCAAKSILGN